jgi:hypothetical protein
VVSFDLGEAEGLEEVDGGGGASGGVEAEALIVEAFGGIDGGAAEGVAEALAAEFFGDVKAFELGDVVGESADADAASEGVVVGEDVEGAAVVDLIVAKVLEIGVFAVELEVAVKGCEGVVEEGEEGGVIGRSVGADVGG